MDTGRRNNRGDIAGCGQRLHCAPDAPGNKGEAAAGRNSHRQIPAPFAVRIEQDGKSEQQQGDAEQDIGDPAEKIRPGGPDFMFHFRPVDFLIQTSQRLFRRFIGRHQKFFRRFRELDFLYLKIGDGVMASLLSLLDLSVFQDPGVFLVIPVWRIGR